MTTSAATSSPTTPVAGYRTLSEATLALVNKNKEVEEQMLRAMDAMRETTEIDQRWLAIARTGMEQAFMALNRAVMKPGRISLPDDGEAA